MDQLYDAMLVVISGCSALYCYMLGRRLRSLHNLKKGMGRAVAHMTQSMGAAESQATKLNRETTTTVAELAAMLARVDAYEQKVDVILGTMDSQSRETWKDFQTQSDQASRKVSAASAELNELVDDAKSLAALMNQQILAMAEVADRQQSLLDALKRTEKRERAARAPKKTVADVRAAATTRMTGTDGVALPMAASGGNARAVSMSVATASSPLAAPAISLGGTTASSAPVPSTPSRIAGSGATRQWANAAAAGEAGQAASPKFNPAQAQRVADIAKRLGLDTAAKTPRRANPFVRDAVKKADT